MIINLYQKFGTTVAIHVIQSLLYKFKSVAEHTFLVMIWVQF